MAIECFITAQPRLLLQTLNQARADLATWQPPPGNAIVLVGSGSSFNALVSTRALFENAQRAVRLVGPETFLRAAAVWRHQSPLVIVLSQSGRSTTSVAAAEVALANDWPLLAITADAASPLAALVPERLLLPIGDEPIGPKTKGYTASLVALMALAERLGGPAPAAFDESDWMAFVAASRTAAVAQACGLDAVDYILVSGTGSLFGAALEASLKISEIAGIPAAAFETEELLHGRLHGLTAKSAAIMIATDEHDLVAAERTATVMAERGARVSILNLSGRASDFDWIMRRSSGTTAVIEAVIPFQWLAVELALRRNMPPEQMKYPNLSQALAIKMPTAS